MHPIASESEWQLLDELARMSANSDSEMASYCTQHHQAICLPEQWCWSQAPTIASCLTEPVKSSTENAQTYLAMEAGSGFKPMVQQAQVRVES
ncbi:transglutaminase [Vibrio vulnificus]|uniref:hypothetical protein n=1 Tax=Vibrio vulnificus TaxID=672 RepID=UPI000DFDDCC8|nr:hypothetical protein [Vibrio vulnificus]SUQ29190.1 transglutaminase [Vibrio vulnificus]